MSLENVQEESAAEGSPAALQERVHRAGGASKQHRNLVAFKFGGSSLLGADRMLHAAGLVRAATRASNVIVVVSAMKGVTDHLLSIARTLADGELAHARREAELVMDLHLVVLRDLQLSEDDGLRVRRELQFLGRDLLHEVPAHGSVAAGAERFDRLASFGERFSARLFAAALEKSGVPAVPVTSSDFVLTCDTFRDAQPHLEQTKQRGRDVLLPLLAAGVVSVVTGFIGATPDGRITTLGRNSSDFSGAIIAHVVDADELVIWTDVDGIPMNPPKRPSCMSSATMKPTPSPRAARKFSTRKCFLSPPKPKWSSGFAIPSIRRRGAHGLVRREFLSNLLMLGWKNLSTAVPLEGTISKWG